MKNKKLSRVKDPLGRNILSQMLNRNPLKRPTLQRVLSYPFLSGAKVSRKVGEKAQFDVFVSPANRTTWRCCTTYSAREVC